MTNGLLANEEFTDEGAAREIFEAFEEVREKDCRSAAHRTFFIKETNFVGAISKSLVNPPYGHEQPILIGQWKYHKDSEIYLRIEHIHSGIALVRDACGIQGSWLFDVRTDVENADGGFLYELHAPAASRPSLRMIKESVPLIEKIVAGIRGYELIENSRATG